MNVSVVIPVLNEADTLEQCLRYIEPQLEGLDELIVVDNGSTDGSVEIAKEYTNLVFEEPHATLGQLRHIGVLLAQNEIVACTDGDTMVSPGWVDRIRRHFESDEELSVVWGRVEDSEGRRIPNAIGGFLNQFGGVSGCNMAVRREDYLKLRRGFDRSVLFEDFQMVHKMAIVGKARRDPDMVVSTPLDRGKYQTKPVVAGGSLLGLLGYGVGGTVGSTMMYSGLGAAAAEIAASKTRTS